MKTWMEQWIKRQPKFCLPIERCGDCLVQVPVKLRWSYPNCTCTPRKRSCVPNFKYKYKNACKYTNVVRRWTWHIEMRKSHNQDITVEVEATRAHYCCAIHVYLSLFGNIETVTPNNRVYIPYDPYRDFEYLNLRQVNVSSSNWIHNIFNSFYVH